MEQNPIIPKNIFDDPIFQIPFDIVKLPSEGKLYAGAIPDSISVEYMVSADEDTLFSSKLMETGTVFDTLVKDKIKDKTINVDDLLLGDYNEILIFLRKSAFGNKYSIYSNDPEVGTVKKEIDLDNLKRNPISAPFDEKGDFEFTLPIMQKVVKFKLITVGMGNNINKTAESRVNPVTGVIPYITTSLEKQITSFGGITDQTYISKASKVIPPQDRLSFLKYVQSISPGVVLSQTFKSEIKEIEYEEKITLGLDFFYQSLAK